MGIKEISTFIWKNALFNSAIKENKPFFFFILSNFNLNFINYEINLDIKRFYDNIFQCVIPLINKPTRVTAETATIIMEP